MRDHRRVRSLTRRGFLAGAGGVAALAVVGCGSTPTDPDPTRLAVARTPPPEAPEVAQHEPRYVPTVRAWLVAVPVSVRARALELLPTATHEGIGHGLLALSDVCPFDRIQLRHCAASASFECPSCGSLFNGLGDRLAGPARAGMSFQQVSLDDDEVVSVHGPPLSKGLPDGVRLVDYPSAGAHCT